MEMSETGASVGELNCCIRRSAVGVGIAEGKRRQCSV